MKVVKPYSFLLTSRNKVSVSSDSVEARKSPSKVWYQFVKPHICKTHNNRLPVLTLVAGEHFQFVHFILQVSHISHSDCRLKPLLHLNFKPPSAALVPPFNPPGGLDGFSPTVTADLTALG